MYHLLKSEKFTIDHALSGLMSLYGQIEIDCFQQFNSALQACEAANNKGMSRFYILNKSGQEYYNGSWIE